MLCALKFFSVESLLFTAVVPFASISPRRSAFQLKGYKIRSLHLQMQKQRSLKTYPNEEIPGDNGAKKAEVNRERRN